MKQLLTVVAATLLLGGCADSGIARSGSSSIEYMAAVLTGAAVATDIAGAVEGVDVDTSSMYQAASSAYRYGSSSPAVSSYTPTGDTCGELRERVLEGLSVRCQYGFPVLHAHAQSESVTGLRGTFDIARMRQRRALGGIDCRGITRCAWIM